MTKVSLQSVDQLAINQNNEAINTLLSSAGGALGKYMSAEFKSRETCLSKMDTALRQAMDLGLVVDHLKAGKKKYTAIVDSIQTARTASGLEPLASATRDNYLSRIRTFVSARGAEPLDVFGNLKAAAQEDNLLYEDKSLRGAPALGAFLRDWIDENDGNNALLKIRTIAQDLLNQINIVTGVKAGT